ncbi:MAG TPA: hypothetical protein VNA12_04125 [Mycobacteriales bacterium]|nr:hypothetical protein [Mycobacteriales bacterium]
MTAFRRSTVTVVAVAALWAAAPTALARPVPKPQIVDAVGDALAGEPSADIVSVTYTTGGKGNGRAYVPQKLIVTLVLADAPKGIAAVGYNLRAETDGCGPVRIRFSPGAASRAGDTSAHFGGCSQQGPVFFNARVDGNVVSFGFGLSSANIERGTRFSDFTATVDINDPVTGEFGTAGPASDGIVDSASGDATWVIP